MTTVTLHVGAHKTASTHYNILIQKNAEALGIRHRRVVSKTETRHLITRRLVAAGKRNSVRSLVRRNIEWLLAASDHVFLSDENILGTTPHVMGDGRLYPRAGPRLGLLGEILRGVRVDIQLAIRAQPDFLAAAYAEALLAGVGETTSQWRHDVDVGAISWLPLIADLRDAFPAARILLWRYEDYGELQPRLFRSALGLAEADLAALPVRIIERVRPTLSRQAMASLTADADQFAGRAAHEVYEELSSLFPPADEHDRYDPWTPAERAVLAANYASDVSALANWPQVELIDATKELP